jgi:uncharacterized protein YkwD
MSRPQRILAGCGIVAFVIGLILMALIGYQYLDALRPRPIRIETLSSAELPFNESNQQISKADYGETLKQSTGSSVVLWGSSRVMLLAGASATIEANKVSASAGRMFIDVVDPITLIASNGQSINLQRVSGVYDAGLQQFFVFTGEVKIGTGSEALTATVNQIVILGGAAAEVGRFNRAELNNADWQLTISELTKHNLLPTTLADIAAPPLIEIEPASDTTVANAALTVTGTTDPETLLYLETELISVGTDGKFSLSLTLNEGSNAFSLIALDASSNETNLVLTYTYQPAAPVAVGCSFADFANQLVCLINQHRSANGLGALSADAALTNAANSHSAWMAANNSLSHDQEAGSANEKFYQRCANAGGSCDAENIAWASPTISPEQVFQMWQNSSVHNVNMLGSHSFIGVGISGTYVTAVFQ